MAVDDSSRALPGAPGQPVPSTSPDGVAAYAEAPPSPALGRHFLCTWYQEIGPGSAEFRHRVLPDGCVDIVWIGEAAPVVVGPATVSVDVPLAPRTRVLGARIRPGHAPALLGFPAHEALNRELRLDAVWGRAAGELTERIVAQATAQAGLAALDALLAERCASAPEVGRHLTAAVAWLAAHPAGRIRELSDLLGVSGRQLQRRLAAAVGYGPKTLQRILRFQRLLARASGTGRAGRDMAGLAAEAGYADQSHMIRDVRALSGRRAAALLGTAASTLRMSDLFNPHPPA
jgi:AraC-like DNA-binding protein